MSAYCTTAEVNSLLKSITISATSKITTAEIDSMITRISNTMDSIVIKQHSLPTTDTEALSILKDICMKLAAAEVVRIMYAGTMKAVPAIAKQWHDDAQKILDGIGDGTIKLEVSVSSDIVHTGTEDENGDEREPNIEIAQEF